MPSPKPPEGLEKRGVVSYGWTPPAGSPVRVPKVKQAQALPGARPSVAGEPTPAELDDDPTKRLGDGLAQRLK
jgi:hypothetical protein